MTSPKDAIQEALARNKQLAARLLVHAQDLGAQVAETESKLTAAGEAAPDLAAVLQARLGQQRGELEDAQREYQAVLQELDSLKTLMNAADGGGVVADLTVPRAGDPLSESVVDQALARVREHAANLEAQVQVNHALASSRAAAALAPPLESAEERARRQLDELKAARDKRGQ